MDTTNWYKQGLDKPLFEDVLWSRPENRAQAGKLLIVGGNTHGFAVPATAYSVALAAKVGVVRVLLPDILKKTLGKMLPEAEFVPSTPNGSLSTKALAPLLDNGEWADAVLLAGDFGRNSETAILLEKFVEKYQGRVGIAEDGLDYFLNQKSPVLARERTLIVINLGKLQKLAKNNRPTTPVLHNMNLYELVTILADWTNSVPTSLITKHADNLVVASKGQVSTTPTSQKSENWQVELAAVATVWWLQQPLKPFEALTSAIYDFEASSNSAVS